MSGRETILATIRDALGASGDDAQRRRAVKARLTETPKGLIPERGQVAHDEQVKLFRKMAEAVHATVDEAESIDDLPRAVADYLRQHNLAQIIRTGGDIRLETAPWGRQKTLEVRTGPAEPDDPVGLTHAFAGVAETGTLLMQSGPDNPSTLNFLPETHIAVIDRSDIAGDYETAFAQLRKARGKGDMPRTLNMITGPSRSADIEQTLLLGAHGPKRLHIVIVG